MLHVYAHITYAGIERETPSPYAFGVFFPLFPSERIYTTVERGEEEEEGMATEQRACLIILSLA